MYKPIKVFIHTPKEGGTAQQGENQKKIRNFPSFPTGKSVTGEKIRLFVEFYGGERGFGDIHIHPWEIFYLILFFFYFKESKRGVGIGNLGQEFVGFCTKYYNFAICAAP